MSDLIEQLRQHWWNQGFTLGNGASESQLKELESKYQIILPDDFKEYLLSINWSRDYDWDGETISFWTINRINEEALNYRRSEKEHYLVFADYLISSHEYAIKLESQATATSPVFFVYYDCVQAAPSFTEFLEGYMANDMDMLMPK
ncbi:MAG: SMI1/KNR4 family protein [Abditibacteriaceae bacterium]